VGEHDESTMADAVEKHEEEEVVSNGVVLCYKIYDAFKKLKIYNKYICQVYQEVEVVLQE
jgi:hypothetical protein